MEETCNYLYKFNEIVSRLMDSKSRNIFNIRLDYFINRNLNKLRTELLGVNDSFQCEELEQFIKQFNKEYPICIWGAGADGRNTLEIIQKMNLDCKVETFCDMDEKLWEKNIKDIPVISPWEVMKQKGKYIVIIASGKYVNEIYEKLLFHKYPRERIFYPANRYLVAVAGNQYFDVEQLEHSDNEVFVDAGSYDFSTSLEFIKWCNGKYSKIYAFEPCHEFNNMCQSTIKSEKIENVEFIEAGTWDETNNKVGFRMNGAGSGIREKGNSFVRVTTIDESVKGDKVTFIKMDVEGSELKSLIGARNTIQRCKPKLAISVYHKPEDILEIPALLLDMLPEYQFYLRHYASNQWETILYAIPQK